MHTDRSTPLPERYTYGGASNRGRFTRLTERMAKTLAYVFGIIFVIVGLLGLFVPNPLIGSGAAAFFATNTLHDSVHLVIGLVLLAVAIWCPRVSSLWLKIIGAIYLVLAILGFAVAGPIAGVMLNDADNWLHVVLGLVLLIAGLSVRDEEMGPRMAAPEREAQV